MAEADSENELEAATRFNGSSDSENEDVENDTNVTHHHDGGGVAAADEPHQCITKEQPPVWQKKPLTTSVLPDLAL